MSLFSKTRRISEETNELRTPCLLKQLSPGSVTPGVSSRCIAFFPDEICSELPVARAK